MQNVEWVPLVNEMFGEGKKLDKFRIDNHYTPEYFSSDCIKQFKENLPFLGKRICFKVACNPAEEELSTTVINDHVIRVRDSRGRNLTIQHSSRAEENF
ncbi:hypothetical protein PFISCL1PPCAC_17956 [Pristionchus fissidentatus]|uniref:Uncharacterized protein n=1 Tax=Pristionchus fissidentatus TaxID=1538716 RepID=A0AAV5W417_9BILA|nr:hypothetical protein PFISCL1PPCAC_17956 [Pristionchus fissidentatus]